MGVIFTSLHSIQVLTVALKTHFYNEFFKFFKELFFEFFLLVVCGGVERDIKNTFAGPHTTHYTPHTTYFPC